MIFLTEKQKNNKGTHGGIRLDLARSRDDYMPNDFMKNKRTVWTVTTKSFSGAHFAVFPPALIEPCILAGCPKDGVVLDPFIGSGTTAIVAYKHNRKFLGIELSEKYLSEITIPRVKKENKQLKLPGC